MSHKQSSMGGGGEGCWGYIHHARARTCEYPPTWRDSRGGGVDKSWVDYSRTMADGETFVAAFSTNTISQSE